MPGSRLSVRQILPLLLCNLCVLAIVVLNGTGANASEREFDVGFSMLSTADPMGGQMRYSLWYPTEVSAGVVRVGPFEFPGTWDAEPAAGPFGLVVLSHGSGGSDLSHWDTAVALAQAGFIAAAPLHPRNNYRHDMHDDARIVLDGRPLQLSAVIDALLAEGTWSSRIDPGRIAAFGFSAGGYTVLAALGAERVYARSLDHCKRHAKRDPYCRIINGPGRAARVRSYAEPALPAFDGRLCAAVIADPLTAPFPDASLKALPPAKLLFFRPEVENKLTAAFHVSRVVRLLKQRDDFPEPREILVPKANHHAFIGPLPDVVARNIPEIASDPRGFDRAAFHDVMNRTIVTFFKQALSDCGKIKTGVLIRMFKGDGDPGPDSAPATQAPFPDHIRQAASCPQRAVSSLREPVARRSAYWGGAVEAGLNVRLRPLSGPLWRWVRTGEYSQRRHWALALAGSPNRVSSRYS